MTQEDVQDIAELFHLHVVKLEQGVSTIRGVNQLNAQLLGYLCDVVDAFYHNVLRRRFPALNLRRWHEACLKGQLVFPKEDA